MGFLGEKRYYWPRSLESHKKLSHQDPKNPFEGSRHLLRQGLQRVRCLVQLHHQQDKEQTGVQHGLFGRKTVLLAAQLRKSQEALASRSEEAHQKVVDTLFDKVSNVSDVWFSYISNESKRKRGSNMVFMGENSIIGRLA